MKQNKQNKNFTKGFTLLELLVVVLIIGILATVALPQYQMAVGKARFSTLKNITKSVQQAAQRYYLVNNVYTYQLENLDIEKPTDIYCSIQTTLGDFVYCGKKIFDKDMYYYVRLETGRPFYCSVYSIDNTNKANRLCQQETNNNKPSCNTEACYYKYKK